MKTLLLSGLGPAVRNESFYRGTFLERGIPTYQRALGARIGAANIVFRRGGSEYPVLRLLRTETPILPTLTLSSALEQFGLEYEAFPLDHIWSQDREPARARPDVVALSTTFICNFQTLGRALRWIRRRFHDSVLVLGGQFSNLKFRRILELHPEVDYIVRGDGELAFPALLRALGSGGDLAAIPNLVFRHPLNGEISHTDIDYVDLEAHPSPSVSGVQRLVPYETMRGCPFSCKFCSYPAASPKWRYKSAGKILTDWIGYAQDNSAELIEAMDSTFTIPRERFRTILKDFRSCPVSWAAFARANDIDSPELVAALEAARCVRLSIGFESMSESSLRNMNKRVTVAENRSAAEHLSKSGIDYRASFIIGYPGETPEDYQSTHDFLVDEFRGRFTLNVFSLVDETMPVWQDAERFDLRVGDSLRPNFSWSHVGMDASTAQNLFRQTVRDVRLQNQSGVFYFWQPQFESPLVVDFDTRKNRFVEKLLERLAFADQDHADHPEEGLQAAQRATEELRDLGIQIILPS